MTRLEAARRFFGELVAASAGATDPRIAEVFASVPREDFLGPAPWLARAGGRYVPTPNDDPTLLYQDRVFALLPEKRLNNGEPTLHARNITAVAPRPGERVLQVGTGGGYYTAILAELVGPEGRVEAREVEPELIAAATRNLAGRANVTVVGRSGLEAPLPASDIIYVCAGATAPMRVWLDALAPGGRLMLPLAPADEKGGMLLITRPQHGTDRPVYAARFVTAVWIYPCFGAQNDADVAAIRAAFARGGARGVKSLRLAPEQPDESCWLAGSGWWLSAAEI
jgi:protein-L-isoaspartate(D-aspartate) O-methyltransferase